MLLGFGSLSILIPLFLTTGSPAGERFPSGPRWYYLLIRAALPACCFAAAGWAMSGTGERPETTGNRVLMAFGTIIIATVITLGVAAGIYGIIKFIGENGLSKFFP